MPMELLKAPFFHPTEEPRATHSPVAVFPADDSVRHKCLLFQIPRSLTPRTFKTLPADFPWRGSCKSRVSESILKSVAMYLIILYLPSSSETAMLPFPCITCFVLATEVLKTKQYIVSGYILRELKYKGIIDTKLGMGGVKGMGREMVPGVSPGTDKVLVLYLTGGLMGACVTAFLSPFQILLFIHLLLLYL